MNIQYRGWQENSHSSWLSNYFSHLTETMFWKTFRLCQKQFGETSVSWRDSSCDISKWCAMLPCSHTVSGLPYFWFLVEATVPNPDVTQRTLRDDCGHWEIWNCMRCVVEWKDRSLYIYISHFGQKSDLSVWKQANRRAINNSKFLLPSRGWLCYCMLARKSNKCPVKHFEVRTILDSGLLWEIRILCAHSKCPTLFVNYLSE